MAFNSRFHLLIFFIAVLVAADCFVVQGFGRILHGKGGHHSWTRRNHCSKSYSNPRWCFNDVPTSSLEYATSALTTKEKQQPLPPTTGTAATAATRNPQSSPPPTNAIVRPRLPILAYHDRWVCINKPTGMSVHRNSNNRRGGGRRGLVVQTTLKRQLSRKVWPVHRLDHRTSGVLLLAFDADMCAQLHSALRSRHYHGDDSSPTNDVTKHNVDHKVYVALLRGNWDEKFDQRQVTINVPLQVDGVLKECVTNFEKLCVLTAEESRALVAADISTRAQQQHQEAQPNFQSSAKLDNQNTVDHNNGSSDKDGLWLDAACTLVLVRPQTGRTHQIRRHAYHMGMPCVGDSQHGDSRVNRYWRNSPFGLNRLALHALVVTLPNICRVHPTNNLTGDDVGQDASQGRLYLAPQNSDKEFLEIVAPLPPDLGDIFRSRFPSHFWQEAVQQEPRLETPWIDIRSGTLGICKPWRQSLR